MVGWLDDLIVEQLDGWKIICFYDRMVGWLNGWMVGQLDGWMVSWLYSQIVDDCLLLDE